MKFRETPLPGVLVVEPVVHRDERGFFMESFRLDLFREAVGDAELEFVQDNHTLSVRNVLRGLHFQRAPHAQGKLVRATRGAIWDVAVDIRRDSPRFGAWHGVELSAGNRLQMWIPPGFAHGFLTLSDEAEVQYKTTAFFASRSDAAVRWDDPGIGVAWPLPDGASPLLSDKDAGAPLLAELD